VAKSTNHKVPHYAIYSSLTLLFLSLAEFSTPVPSSHQTPSDVPSYKVANTNQITGIFSNTAVK